MYRVHTEPNTRRYDSRSDYLYEGRILLIGRKEKKIGKQGSWKGGKKWLDKGWVMGSLYILSNISIR